MEPPELWWSPSVAEGSGHEQALYLVADGSAVAFNGHYWDGERVPADAVPLVPAEPVDEKSRGEAYQRGFVDGRMAQRAAVLGGDTRTALARAGLSEHEVDLVEAYYVGLHASDPPPFAPELADAPLPTGESGAPAPLVVDQPVHDSTLPAELEDPVTRAAGPPEIDVDDRDEVCDAELAARYDEQPTGCCSLSAGHAFQHECGFTGWKWRDTEPGATPATNGGETTGRR